MNSKLSRLHISSGLDFPFVFELSRMYAFKIMMLSANSESGSKRGKRRNARFCFEHPSEPIDRSQHVNGRSGCHML